MNRRCSAALLGGLFVVLALSLPAPPAAAAANPQVEAELTRLIAGYAASGQEGFDKLSEDGQKRLAACAADVLGDLPDDEMNVLTTGQDLEQVMDTIGQSFENRAGTEAGEQLMGCFDTAMAEIESGDAGTASMTELPPATGVKAEFQAALEQVLRDSEPPSEAAVHEMIACMMNTLGAVMSDEEMRAAIDTSFGEEVGQQLQGAHPAEFDAFMACGEEIAAKYE